MELGIRRAGVTQSRQTGIKTPYALKRYLANAQTLLQFLPLQKGLRGWNSSIWLDMTDELILPPGRG
ncbi:hypothetical protein AOLI_G00021550 [Acnodon oligacanthus]